jgi:hypothetical protein
MAANVVGEMKVAVKITATRTNLGFKDRMNPNRNKASIINILKVTLYGIPCIFWRVSTY